jgi:hypothetical protein
VELEVSSPKLMIAPTPLPDNLVTEKSGYIKVMLSFFTPEPKHLRSIQLARFYGVLAPYSEEVAVLLPKNKVFALLETFIPVFESLQKLGIVHEAATLRNFHILDEDNLTLAYIFKNTSQNG